jgi:L-2,4-diaminobutyrate decarboxylase
MNIGDAFLGPELAARGAYARAMALAQAQVLEQFAPRSQAWRGTPPAELQARFAALDPCPEDGEPLAAVLQWAGTQVLADCVVVHHPLAMAHLHCAPLLSALAAEAMLSAANASMDSWDQAPAPTHLEQRLVQWLGQRFGLGAGADGIFTSGGTQSNFVGLLLARDRACRREWGTDVQRSGLPPQAPRLRILCSAVAHFSVQQSAAILGLGHDAVVPVATDAARRMDPAALADAVAALRAQGQVPFAVVGTAGSTDFGSIDPLPALAHVAALEGLWLHVDAAYGGALVLSDRLRPLLQGVEHADSLTVDFHKLFWQPVSASALLVRDAAAWDTLRLHADYLNPEDEDTVDLVTKSIQTTRRFDALKVWVSLRTLGRRRFAELIECTVDLAQAVGRCIDADPAFERMAPVAINSVVFRCTHADWSAQRADHVNAVVRRRLLHGGRALVGRTRVDGRYCLKFTLLNPATTLDDVQRLLADIRSIARDAA